MVQRKPVKSLKICCIKQIPLLIANHARKMASKASALHWHGVFQGNMKVNKELLMEEQISETRNFIFSHVLWHDYELVFKAILKVIPETFHYFHTIDMDRRKNGKKLFSTKPFFKKELFSPKIIAFFFQGVECDAILLMLVFIS